MNLSDLFPYWPALRPAFGTVSSIPTTPAPGATYQVSAYPGSRLYTMPDGKLGGTVGWLTVANGGLSDANTIAASVRNANLAPGALAFVPNPAVSRGWSRLLMGPKGFAPPSGELIANTWATETDLWPKLVTPAVTSLTQIWASPVIPNYMIPDLLEMEASANIGAKNASGVAGCMLGVTISGAAPVTANYSSYVLGINTTPTAFPRGIGAGNIGRRYPLMRYGEGFYSPDPMYGDGSTSIRNNLVGTFSSGSPRLYAMAKPSDIADQIHFDGAQVWSKGNI